FAKDDLATAQTRVVAARQAMTAFRNANLIVDPTADLAGRMGLLNSLIAQKAAALIEFDVLMASPIRANDPRVEAAEQRLQIVDQLIARERQSFGPGDGEGGNYAQLVSQFERLSVESEFAEKSYVAALVGFDAAQADARRTTKYLAAHMPPTRAQLAQYPQRFLIVTLALIALSVVWMIGLLMYYAVRDRR
ncbi:MAG: sugar transporter, partial [Planktomarina sp.]